ncbi:MAG: TlpA family protein disulfide reductase [Magnetococcus sp. WYHC-3]
MRTWKIMAWIWMLLGLTLTSCGERTLQRSVGQSAPAFQLTSLQGTTLHFPRDTIGHPVVVRFWADWCPHCREEMPVIDVLYRQRQGSGLRILAVNLGQSEQTVRQFAQDMNLSYDMLLDPESHLAREYGVLALPTTFFVDGTGVIRGRILGESDRATFESQLALITKP